MPRARTPNVGLKKGERAAKHCTLITLILSVLKGSVGLFSGSIALLADAVHSFSDIFGSLAVFIGLKLAQKKPTEKFPYGYYKAETFASLIVSVIIILSGIEVLIESFRNFLAPSIILSPFFVLLTATVSAIVSYFLAKYKERVGKQINSQSLINEGKHSRTDVYFSLLVFAGTAFSYSGFPWVEALAGVIISLFVIKMGLFFGKDAILVLMDACLRPDIVGKIRQIAENVQGVRGIHDLKVRRSGMFVFGEMHVEIEERLPVEKAHRISEDVENKVKETIKEVDSLTIHVEPAKRKKLRIAIPIEDKKGLESKPKPHFGKSPYFILINVENGKIESWTIKENPGIKLEKKKGITAANFLADQKVDTVLTKELGEGPFHVLRDNFIEIYRLPKSAEVKEIIDLFLKEKLKIITIAKKK